MVKEDINIFCESSGSSSPPAQNSLYAKVAYFGKAHFEPLDPNFESLDPKAVQFKMVASCSYLNIN